MGESLTDDQRLETERHRCEVRELLQLGVKKGHYAVDSRIEGIEKARGKAGADRLRTDYKAQWRAGNRGENRDWRELGLTP